MNKLLAWAVLTLAIMAGFTARADDSFYRVTYNTKTKAVWCGYDAITNEDDVVIGGNAYYTVSTCMSSTEFKSLQTKYNGKTAFEHRLWYSNKFNFVFCGTPLAADPGDYLISKRRFSDLGACSNSKIYKYMDKQYSSNSTKPPGVDGKKPVVKTPPKPQPKPVLTDIQKYIKIFEEQTKISVRKTKITLGNLKKGTVGVCYGKNRQIKIDKTYWNSDASAYDKELTIYHELGHCVLNRAHYNPTNMSFVSPTLQRKCPISIMYWKSYGAKEAYRCFHEHRKYYWNELISGTFAMRAYKTEGDGKEEKLFSFYLDEDPNKKKVGAFTCKYNLGRGVDFDTISEIWVYAQISCTRDQVIFYKLDRFFKSAVGDNAIHNLKRLAQNEMALELRLHDKILNQKFRIVIKKVSPDLW